MSREIRRIRWEKHCPPPPSTQSHRPFSRLATFCHWWCTYIYCCCLWLSAADILLTVLKHNTWLHLLDMVGGGTELAAVLTNALYQVDSHIHRPTNIHTYILHMGIHTKPHTRAHICTHTYIIHTCACVHVCVWVRVCTHEVYSFTKLYRSINHRKRRRQTETQKERKT